MNTPVEWESHAGTKPGTLSDLSRDGCFILSSGNVAPGEQIFIHLPLSSGEKAKFPAEISESVFDIGFAAKFAGLTEGQIEFLERFVELSIES
jgi:hypothetical protein